jgi:DNA-binding MarR family transcriptional regulator
MAAHESGARTPPTQDEVDAVMLAAQVLVGVTAQSVSPVEDVVTLPQLRVLVIISSRGPLNLNAVAQAIGVHPSNATRACDRLVSAGLLDRRDSPADRRNVSLDPTPAGRALVQMMVAHRRDAIAQVLQRIPATRRRPLVPALRSFGAAGEGPVPSAWSMGWPPTTLGPDPVPVSVGRLGAGPA